MIDPLVIESVVDAALREDIGLADLTSELVIPADTVADLTITTRQDIVVAGIDVAAAAFRRREPSCAIALDCADGARLVAGRRLGHVRGPARGLLTAERTALNLLQHLSGIATLTARYVAAIAHTKAVLVDTRKTTPGLRALEKHAVQVGGGRNHRLRLDDGVLIKDNHIALCGGVAAAVARARAGVPLLTKIEVECDTLDQVEQGLAAGADMLLLDNMDLATLRRAVALVARRVPLEASGGVTLETIAQIAETGVDFISTGRLTQAAPAVDIGLDVTMS
ncbi:MAG TPA: carboxylating nicotinate-nucleotide diphosphorylase [Candidatus Sulfotelmatobacter sp.]|nr:carboxylating nicotinate-nucleotide diphosphorylase [Candidatus Sulfotelmatobacter sp.]